MTTTIRLQREPFDVAAEVERMTHGRTDIGAVVTFTGLCRADENGRPIAALTLEHYPGMAEAEIGRHVEEAYARWPLLDVTVIHRFGRLEPGDVIVLVATASSHREAAFQTSSARHIIRQSWAGRMRSRRRRQSVHPSVHGGGR